MTTSTQIIRVYDEIVEFIAAGTTPQSIVDFKLSDTTKDRLEDLVYRTKNEGLTDAEKRELDNYLTLEHVMRLAKARAHHYINLLVSS